LLQNTNEPCVFQTTEGLVNDSSFNQKQQECDDGSCCGAYMTAVRLECLLQ